MANIILAGVRDIITEEYLLSPVFQVGDVQVSVNGLPFINTVYLPQVLVPGEAPIIELTLDPSEYDRTTILRFEDLDLEWETFSVYNLHEESYNSTLITLLDDLRNEFLSRLRLTPLTIIGSPLEAGVLRLVKNKDYKISNDNAVEIRLPNIPAVSTSDEVLLTTRGVTNKQVILYRLAATSVATDSDGDYAVFEIDGDLLTGTNEVFLEYMIELRHGTDYNAVMIGRHILLEDLAG